MHLEKYASLGTSTFPSHTYERMNELLKSESFARLLLNLFNAFLHETKESDKRSVALLCNLRLSVIVDDY